MNSSPNSNCRRSKSAIFISHNINSNINSLLRLRVGKHIIYIYIYIYRALHTGSRNENNIGAAAPPHSNYLRVFLRFRRTFAEVITFGEASAHEFQPKFKLSAFEIGHLYFAQYKF